MLFIDWRRPKIRQCCLLDCLVSSAAAIAYSSTLISVSFDTNPQKRSISPAFYGYMPDKGRFQVFILMVIMTTTNVLMKVLACSLLLRLSQTWFFLYSFGDVSIFFLYKIATGDLRNWVRLDGITSWVGSILYSIFSKIVVDFCLIMQFRRKYFRFHEWKGKQN